MKNTPNIYFQEYLKNGKERWKPLLIAAFSFRHRHVCMPLIYGETIYYIYIYLSHLFIPARIFFSIWKLPTSVKGSIVTIHCDKCCGKGGIFFFCPQNKAMLMFTHRCLCWESFIAGKTIVINGWPSTEFKFSVSWTQVCDLQLGFEQSPLSDGTWGFSGAGQPHLGAHVWPSETGWFLCHLPSPCWELQGGFMAALPCRTRSLALTSPDLSYPGASVCHGPHQLQRKVPPPPLQALVKHHQFWRKMDSREEEDTTEP